MNAPSSIAIQRAFLVIAASAALMLSGGCAGCRQQVSHMKSGVFGLSREITLYANDGSVIRTWKTKGSVEDQGGSFRFLVDGKAITIAGTAVIEEK